MMLKISIEILAILLAGIICFAAGYFRGRKAYYQKCVPALEEYLDKNKRMSYRYRCMYHWLLLRQQNKHLSDFFIYHQIDQLAIYGYGILGKMVREELEKNGIVIKFLIDRSAKTKKADLPIYEMEEDLPEIEVILVTADNVGEVKAKLSGKRCEVIDLDEVLLAAGEK